MQQFVKSYCTDKHVFQLLFDATALIECEKHIRFELRRGKETDYNKYHNTISKPFLDNTNDDWEKLENVRGAIQPTIRQTQVFILI